MSARIAMVTGSHHQQVYWISTRLGNMQMALPFTYLLEDHRWVPGNDTFLRGPTTPPTMKTWNLNCIKCHATGGQPRPDAHSQRMDSRVGELGIACESCHDSGVEHVRANQNPARRYLFHSTTRPDPTIVNPARLPARLSAQVCGQCHGVKWIPEMQQWGQTGFRYRPGADLGQSTPLVRLTRLHEQPWVKEHLKSEPAYLEQRFWSDGMVRVSGREYNGLVESACHQKGELSCLSCHSLHQSQPDDQLAAGMATSQACLQCHQNFRDRIAQHTHHQPGSSGSDCYNCHMPYTTYGLLKAIRSHQIDSPSVDSSKRTGRPNACNLCHLDQSLGWTARHLSEWYRIPTSSLSAEDESVSAGVTWLLKGDAGQRALIACSMGWPEARQTSGETWMPPYLAQLLEDPYAAVRYIAARSLHRLAGYRDLAYDYIGPATQRTEAHRRALEIWKKSGTGRPSPARPQVLLGPDGALQQESFDRLLRLRDDHYMDLQE